GFCFWLPASGSGSFFAMIVLQTQQGTLRLGTVPEPRDTCMLGTVGAAKDDAIVFDAVANHAAAAMVADGSQRVDGALERIKGLREARHRYGEGLVVVVATHVTFH